jgi:hypothetical protein
MWQIFEDPDYYDDLTWQDAEDMDEDQLNQELVDSQ